MQGFLDKGLLEIHNLKIRHDDLAREIEARGMNHKSPMEYHEFMSMKHRKGFVDNGESLKELSRRCPDCRRRIS